MSRPLHDLVAELAGVLDHVAGELERIRLDRASGRLSWGTKADMNDLAEKSCRDAAFLAWSELASAAGKAGA